MERKGSLGLKGGNGILGLINALTVVRVLNLLGGKREEEEEGEVGMDMGKRKHVVAIVAVLLQLQLHTRHFNSVSQILP